MNTSDICFFWHDDFPILINPEGVEINQYSKNRITLITANTGHSKHYTFIINLKFDTVGWES